MSLNKRDELRIRAALGNLTSLCDPAHPSCSIHPFDPKRDAATREAVAIYIKSWVMPGLENVLNGSEWDDAEKFCAQQDAAKLRAPKPE